MAAHDSDAAQGAISLPAKVLAFVAAMVVAAGLCEVMARAVYPAPQDPTREPRILYQRIPGGAFVHVPNQRGWIDSSSVTTNSLGLRGPDVAVPKPSGVTRVLTIGDSTTFGLDVNDDETYQVPLESKLKTVGPRRQSEVINGGVSGYNLTLDLALMRHLIPVLRPDVVLVGPYWNDLPYEAVSPDGVPVPGMAGAPQTPTSSPTSAPSTPAGGAASSQTPSAPFRIGNQLSTTNRLLRSSRLLYVLRQTWLARVGLSPAAQNELAWETALLEGRQSATIDDAWRSVTATLEEIRALGQTEGCDVGVVIMPIRAQVEQSFPHEAYQKRFRAIAESLGLFVVDPLTKFIEQPDHPGLFIPYDRMHYSARGNAVLADAIYDVLQTRPAFAAPGVP